MVRLHSRDGTVCDCVRFIIYLQRVAIAHARFISGRTEIASCYLHGSQLPHTSSIGCVTALNTTSKGYLTVHRPRGGAVATNRMYSAAAVSLLYLVFIVGTFPFRTL